MADTLADSSEEGSPVAQVHHAPIRRLRRDRRRTRAELRNLRRIAEAMARTLGPHVEVVVHDLSDLEHTIVAIVGEVTHRRVGGCPTDLLLEKIRNRDFQGLFNYRSYTDDGKVLRSSSVFLEDEAGRPTGVFCINVDVSAFVAFGRLLQSMAASETSSPVVSEGFAEDAGETVRIMVAEAAAEIGKPLGDMAREERIRLIGVLDQKGLFQVKRAVPLVAIQLRVSRFTVYAYLQEARARGDNGRT